MCERRTRKWPGRDPAIEKIAARRLRLFSLDLAVRVVLRHVGPEVVDLFLVLDAGKEHLGTRHLGLRVLDVFLEVGLIPGDAGVLVGFGVIIVRRTARLAPVEPVEFRSDLVLGVLADRVTGQALVEGVLAGVGVLRQRGRYERRRCKDDQRARYQFFHSRLFLLGTGKNTAVVA